LADRKEIYKPKDLQVHLKFNFFSFRLNKKTGKKCVVLHCLNAVVMEKKLSYIFLLFKSIVFPDRIWQLMQFQNDFILYQNINLGYQSSSICFTVLFFICKEISAFFWGVSHHLCFHLVVKKIKGAISKKNTHITASGNIKYMILYENYLKNI
jgi:hypothetical protein